MRDGRSGNGAETLSQVYVAADPVLSLCRSLDKPRHTIVWKESAEIIRMFNGAFDGIGAAPGAHLQGGQQRRIPRRLCHHADRGQVLVSLQWANFERGICKDQQTNIAAVASASWLDPRPLKRNADLRVDL
jgi:glutathionyl-hydroquinone reductase